MFTRLTCPRAGRLLSRVNFAVPDNFPSGNRAASTERLILIPEHDDGAEPSNQYSTPVKVRWTWLFTLNKR
jgi:hypothetical protein